MIRNILSLFALFVATTSVWGSAQIGVDGSAEFDFGTFSANIQKETSFTIVNKGKSDLKITRISKTCGCAEVKIGQKEIKPGEKTDLKIVLKPDGSLDGKFDKKVYLVSNDPKKKIFPLTLKGNAIPLYNVKPKKIFYAGRIALKTWTKTFDLIPTAKNSELGFPMVQSNYPASAQLEKKKDGKYKLIVTADFSSIKGNFKATVKIPVKTPKNWFPVTILLAAKVGHEFYAAPGRLFLPASTEKEITKTFELKTKGNFKVASDAIKVNRDDVNVKYQNSKGNATIVKCGFTPEFIKELNKKKQIVLKFEYPGAEEAVVKCVKN